MIATAQAETLKYFEKRPTLVTGESYDCRSGAGLGVFLGETPRPAKCEVSIDEISAGEAEYTGLSQPLVIIPSHRVKLPLKSGGWISTASEEIGMKVGITAKAREGNFKFVLRGKNVYERIECVVTAGEEKICQGNLMRVYERMPKRIYQYFEVEPVSAVVKGLQFEVVGE